MYRELYLRPKLRIKLTMLRLIVEAARLIIQRASILCPEIERWISFNTRDAIQLLRGGRTPLANESRKRKRVDQGATVQSMRTNAGTTILPSSYATRK